MDQDTLETHLIDNLIGPGHNVVWRIEDVRHALEGQAAPFNKRTLERRVADIPWLACLNKTTVARDESDRPIIQAVADALLTDARKKRKAALFVALHKLPVANQEALSQESSVLVAEDGKGAKRWCYIASESLSNVKTGLLALTEDKPAVFFPIGNLVGFCRAIKQTVAETKTNAHLEIMTAHFPEMKQTSRASAPESKTMTPNKAQATTLSHLDRLEAESLYIIREVMAHADNPVMLYSVGKDSSVMLHLARKAFYPSPPPFPLMHVDTRWKFQAMYDFRDAMAAESNMDLIIHVNPEGIEKNINPFDHGSALHTDIMKTQGLKQALDLHQFDVAFGGARRDEEKSRAKERIFSFRSRSHRWDPKNQRPELWNLYNCRKAPGESIRVFPLSNWTELDIWQYIYREDIPIVPLYFAAERPVVDRNGMLIMIDDNRMQLQPGEKVELKQVRFRTLGCYPLTGAVESSAVDLSQIVLELLHSRTSERQGRAIDSDGSASMEKKKQEGYF